MDLSKDYNLYAVFMKVCDVKSYSKAAEQLGYSAHQPISEKMQLFANQLGLDTLFVRHSRGVVPTDLALDLYKRVKPHFDAIDCAEDEVKEFNEDTVGKIRLRCPSHISKFAVSKCVSKFRDKHPNIKFAIKRMPIDESLIAMKNGDLDLVLTLSTFDTNFDTITLHEFSNTFFATKQFLAKNGISKNITIAQLQKLPIIFSEKAYFNHPVLNKIDPIIETSSVEMMYDAVLDNLGIGYGYEDYISENFVKLNITDYKIPKSPLVIMYRKNFINKAVHTFLNYLITHFKNQ